MAILAGIDEAGLGPVLGPLVVSSAVMEVPDELLSADLWQVLAGAVSTGPARDQGRFAIADSKRLYRGRRGAGLQHLERGVLAAVWACGSHAGSLRGLLAAVAPATLQAMECYPWYRDRDLELPLAGAADQVIGAATLLLHEAEPQGLRLRCLEAEVVLAGELNQLLSTTGNKSLALFQVTARHLQRLREYVASDRRLVVYLDRHGARKRYRGLLQEAFGGAWVWTREETTTCSTYTVETEAGVIDLCFAVACEQQQLPVALASMASKYLRELFLQLLNSFWSEQVPGLRPTAGYAVDGRRFFTQIGPRLQELGIDPRLLYRNR